MSKQIHYSEVPGDYLMCLNRECTKADTCLRQLVERTTTAKVHYMRFMNPKYLAELKGDCPYYKSSAPVRYAKGFMKLLGNIPLKETETIKRALIALFHRVTYYRVRNGERLLSPEEQAMVLKVTGSRGLPPGEEFDSYIEDYDW